MIRATMSKDRVVATKHTQYLLIGTFWTCGAVFLAIPALLEGQWNVCRMNQDYELKNLMQHCTFAFEQAQWEAQSFQQQTFATKLIWTLRFSLYSHVACVYMFRSRCGKVLTPGYLSLLGWSKLMEFYPNQEPRTSERYKCRVQQSLSSSCRFSTSSRFVAASHRLIFRWKYHRKSSFFFSTPVVYKRHIV